MFESCLYYVGLGILIFAPIAAGLLCGAVGMQAVKFSHCRNKLVAGLLGIAMGLTAYVGSYHACLVAEVGLANAHRVDALPYYIYARLQTDTIRDARGSSIEQQQPESVEDPLTQPPTMQFWMNAGLSALEALLCAASACGIAMLQAKRPYCSKHECWLDTSKGIPQPSGGGIADEFTIQDWLRRKDVTQHELHVCPHPSVVNDACEIYLSAYQFDDAQRNERGQTLLNLVELQPREIAEFAELLPAERLKSISRSENSQWREVADGIQEISRETVERVGPHSLATVERVESQYYGELNSDSQVRLRNLMVFLPILGGLLGFALLACPLFVSFEQFPILNSLPLLGTLCSLPLLGILLLNGTAFLCKVLSTSPYNSMRTKAEQAFPGRVTSIVDFQEEHRFALVMPRSEIQSNFFRSWDFGFLQADLANQEIRFEGDMERYRIPLKAILDFSIDRELFCNDARNPSFEYLVKIRFQTAEGPVERLFAQRHLWQAGSVDVERQIPARELADYLTFAAANINTLATAPAEQHA